MNQQEKKSNVKDKRNIYFGIGKEEIADRLRAEFGHPENPKEKFKAPKYKNNKVRTSKYNIINFLPKSILAQFMRLYNFYFLVTVVLQGVPQISTMPIYLAALPFLFVLSISIFREGLEDIKRKIQDRKTNNRKALVLKDQKFHETWWANLKIGDVILVHDGETLPADLLLLQWSDSYGKAYIQTMTLDGENALKERLAYTEIWDSMREQRIGLDKMQMHLRCDKPNNMIYQFEGLLYFESPEIPTIKASIKQFLLRGSVLANTDWAIGLVVYAGHDTKLLKNLGKSKYKQTHIEKTLNNVVVFLILFQIVLCILATVLAADYNNRHEIKSIEGSNKFTGFTYLEGDPNKAKGDVFMDDIFGFLKFFLLLSGILPISLLVSLEVIKALQAYWIVNDATMFSVDLNQKCKVMSMSLNEELGLINNVFTDKTGTLTTNVMLFKACSVAKVKYDKKSIKYMQVGDNSDNEDSKNNRNSDNIDCDWDESVNDGEDVLTTMKKILINKVDRSENYNEYRFGNIRITKQTDFLHYFWMALSLCHEVISISENKQKIKKQHFDDIFMEQESSVNSSKQKIHKKGTFDHKIRKKCTINEDKKSNNQDDFELKSVDKLSEEFKSDENMDEEDLPPASHNLESDSFDISEQDIDEDDTLLYHGTSPDEITLVNAAKSVGYEFRFRSNNKVEIKVDGKSQILELCKIFPFTSDRKRMTIVVKDPKDPEYVIAFVKGADNVMQSLALKDFNSHFDFSYINKFACKGYRTLIVGMKVIKYEEYLEWEGVYDLLHNDMENDNTNELATLISSIESELFLLGTTALEDKLQENVHECIEEFRRADIKVWMITGDKLETAENVGVSCRLLHEDAERFIMTSKNNKAAKNEAKRVYATMKSKIRNQKIANEADVDEVESESSFEVERVSEHDGEVAEEDKHYENGEPNLNSSFHTHQQNQEVRSNLAPSRRLLQEQYSVTDLFSPDKKLRITEKKMFVKQIVLNSSFSTTFNVNKLKALPVAELSFEIVIEGECLAFMFKEENRKLFGKIIQKAAVVLVCRASPKQKAEVIEFAKEIDPSIVSLAIGDGGNDVSMIKAADVGVGIFGKEGYQAVSASDYAIGEFQYLKRLMFIHGRWNVRRITVFITQFLLKNLIFSLSQFCFAFYSGYSGQTFFEPGYVSIFNTFSTQLIVCYYAVYDQDICCSLKDKTTKLLMPYLYAETRDETSFNVPYFLKWYAYGGYVGVMLFYVSYYTYLYAMDVDGKTFGLWQFSFSPYVAICAIHLIFMALYMKGFSLAHLAFFFIHIVLFFPGWMYVYNMWNRSAVYQNVNDFYLYGLFWTSWILTTVAAVIPIVFVMNAQSIFFPRLIDLVLSKKFDKRTNIEEKLKIDIVKLDKDLDSDSDEDTVRMSVGIAQMVKTSHPPTHENMRPQSMRSEQSEMESKSETEKFDDHDEISSIADSNYNQSESGIRSVGSASLGKLLNTRNVNSQSKMKMGSSLRRSRGAESPTFDRFTGNVQEFKLRTTTSVSESSKNKKKRTLKNEFKFYPHGSSINGGDTIQEKSDEEDKEEHVGKIQRRGHDKFEESSNYSSSIGSRNFESSNPDKYNDSLSISNSLDDRREIGKPPIPFKQSDLKTDQTIMPTIAVDVDEDSARDRDTDRKI